MRSITFWDHVQDREQGLLSLTRISLFACVHRLLSWHYNYEVRLVPLIAAVFSG
jgi:hypothetical protein